MKRRIRFLNLLPVLLIQWGCAVSTHPEPCSPDWYPWVEAQLTSGDGMGHGPDIGSMEWQSVIEFKLGVRGQAAVPPRSSDSWCEFIDRRIRALPEATLKPLDNTATIGNEGELP